jgi:predicted nucleic acid-binding Zn ribbon protein
MQICVCGWYYDAELYRAVWMAGYYPTVIAHRDAPAWIREKCGVHDVENVGLEFGAYDWYLKNAWDNESSVLFMHDDITIARPAVIHEISQCTCDQAFIFRDEADGRCNQNFHGRMFYCSAGFLHAILQPCECPQAFDRLDEHNNHFCSSECAEKLRASENWRNVVVKAEYQKGRDHKRCTTCGTIIRADEYWGIILVGQGAHTGFWFDRLNRGHNSGRPPVGVRHYNDAIYHFALQCSRLKSGGGLDSNKQIYFDSLNLHKRGRPR